MKLRIRNTESKQTLRIEVPDSCSFYQLKQFIAQAIDSFPSSLRLSLNRHEELQASSPQESLHSIGITAGDLIFYSIRPSGSSSQTLASHSHSHSQSSSSSLAQQIGHDNLERQHRETVNPIPPIGEALMEDSSVQVKSLNSQADEFNSSNSVYGEERVLREGLNTQKEKGHGFSGCAASMDIDDESIELVGKKFAVPFYLRRVLKEVLGDELEENSEGHKLIVIAVHAVLKESGFVGFDSVSGMRVDRFHLPDEWPSMGFTVSLCYTLPEILANGGGNSSNLTEIVVVKFQSLGHLVNVYGSLANDSSGLCRVCLDKNRFCPTINSLRANRNPQGEIAEFWRNVKDGLALPLLIDLCAKAGLACPPCLMRLPPDLKLKILEFLPGNDIAKVGCACKELQILSCNDDLWKQKYVEELGSGTAAPGLVPWKKRFATLWETKKAARSAPVPYYAPFLSPLRRDAIIFQAPRGGMRGGDYDRLPGFSAPSPFGQPGRLPRYQYRRLFTPNCNLGGLSG